MISDEYPVRIQRMPIEWLNRLSMESRGSRRQIRAAAALMAVLPNMVLCHLLLFSSPDAYSPAAKTFVAALAILVAVGGFVLLNRYPRNVGRLRQYLLQIARGELPDSIALPESENDVRDVERFLNLVLDELRRKVKLLETQLRLSREMKNALESQQRELLDAERHRVMINSLGAACHHVGQPAAILRARLHLLKGHSSSPAEQAEIAECERALDSIADVLEKLRGVGEYRTVPYRACPVGVSSSPDMEILDIESSAPPPPVSPPSGTSP